MDLTGAQQWWLLTAEPTAGWEPRNAPMVLIDQCARLHMVEPTELPGVWRLTPAGVAEWFAMRRRSRVERVREGDSLLAQHGQSPRRSPH